MEATTGCSDFWEDERALPAEAAALYYDYFAQIFLRIIPVPGNDEIERIREDTYKLFDLESADERPRLLASFLASGDDDKIKQERLAIDRTYLCRGVDPEGLQPPYEMFWRTDRPTTLTDIEKAYSQSGLQPSSSNRERPDYIGTEFAFLSNLAAREAMLLHDGSIVQSAVCRKQREAFVAEHLAAWLPHYTAAALAYAKTDFFRGLLPIITDLLAMD